MYDYRFMAYRAGETEPTRLPNMDEWSCGRCVHEAAVALARRLNDALIHDSGTSVMAGGVGWVVSDERPISIN